MAELPKEESGVCSAFFILKNMRCVPDYLITIKGWNKQRPEQLLAYLKVFSD
jgi:hypothetical protein